MSVKTSPPAPAALIPPRQRPTRRALEHRVGLRDLEQARLERRSLPMLTCYDFTTATVMQRAGVPLLLVGDSAAVVVLGYESTVAIRQPFLQELTAAVRRGAPLAYLMADMPFGSYHGDEGTAVDNVCEMVRTSGCDGVKLEVTTPQATLVARLADAGVAIWAHLGLRPQSAQRTGYRTQGRTSASARAIVEDARRMRDAGAVGILLEAVPPEVGEVVTRAVELPVIGCGAGPSPMAHVVVLQDLLGLSGHRPRFVPELPEPLPLEQAVAWYADLVESGDYPGPEHCYSMASGERDALLGHDFVAPTGPSAT